MYRRRGGEGQTKTKETKKNCYPNKKINRGR
jgi:hypothetical protein